MSSPFHSTDEVAKETMRLHRSLPPRPPIDDVEAAMAIIRDVDKEERSRTETILRQQRAGDIPEELFCVLQEMQRSMVRFQSKTQRREAMRLLDLESVHSLFDDLIQKASRCLPVSPNGPVLGSSIAGVVDSGPGVYSEKDVRDDSFPKKTKAILKAPAISGEEHEKLSLIKLASMIEISSKKGSKELNLQNKLMDEVEWLPNSIGKLSFLTTLNLSENNILNIPNTIGSLHSLRTLDFRGNRITDLPTSIGDLLNICHLNLRGNQLTSLPPNLINLVNLEELDLSSNKLSWLPEAVGQLNNLKKLNVEANNIEELPHTIGNCNSLVELRIDYNHIKCLPEAIGRLGSLEILSVRYNNIKGLPTTMASLPRLKELDVSFNELESIPESLCLVTTLVKLNVGNNFADLQSLPRAIGNLEMLEELDVTNNQIKVLPDSFGMLTQLCVLRMEENPLEVPPRQVAEMGAQAVVHYMAEMAARRAVRSKPAINKKTCSHLCCFQNSSKMKRSGLHPVRN